VFVNDASSACAMEAIAEIGRNGKAGSECLILFGAHSEEKAL
jgi:hypothetical protein